MKPHIRLQLTATAVALALAANTYAADQTLQKTTVVAPPAPAAQATTPAPAVQKLPPTLPESATPPAVEATSAAVQDKPKPTVVRKKKVRRRALPDQPAYASRRVVAVSAANAAPPYVTDNIQEGRIDGVQTVVSRYGENHRVTVSRNMPNIIMTPFVHARATGTSKDFDLGTNGSAILITPRTGKAMWLSITDADNPGTMPVSLTLVPRNIGSQTIVASTGSEGATPTAPNGGGLPQQLAAVLKEIVMQKLPAGYSVRPFNHTFSMANGIAVQPVERYSNHQYDVYRYRLRNRGNSKQVLSEEAFGANDRIAAVAFFPKIVLHPGETTDVLIMVGKGGVK